MHELGSIAAVTGGLALIVAMLRDAFETMILPRRVNSRWRFARGYYRLLWPLWSRTCDRIRNSRRREALLSVFGPLSLLVLFITWAWVIVVGFGLLYWGAGAALRGTGPGGGFTRAVYFAATTFSTLGLGDVLPADGWGRFLCTVEGGMGFGFVAIIIGYMPVLYGSFSRREASISLLDARAGSPPSASELLRRHADDRPVLDRYLSGWEQWAAEVLESQISYPVLGFFRSQHVNQSWLAALTTILDSCALLVAAGPEAEIRQAQLTFAMARHAVVDLAQTFVRALPGECPLRLSEAQFRALAASLTTAGLRVNQDPSAWKRLTALRGMYEPHVLAISRALRLELPAWIGDAERPDNWQRSPWDRAVSRTFRPREDWSGGSERRRWNRDLKIWEVDVSGREDVDPTEERHF